MKTGRPLELHLTPALAHLSGILKNADGSAEIIRAGLPAVSLRGAVAVPTPPRPRESSAQLNRQVKTEREPELLWGPAVTIALQHGQGAALAAILLDAPGTSPAVMLATLALDRARGSTGSRQQAAPGAERPADHALRNAGIRTPAPGASTGRSSGMRPADRALALVAELRGTGAQASPADDGDSSIPARGRSSGMRPADRALALVAELRGTGAQASPADDDGSSIPAVARTTQRGGRPTDRAAGGLPPVPA